MKTHEARKADEIDPVRFELMLKRMLEAFAILAVARVIDDCGRDARRLRRGEARGV